MTATPDETMRLEEVRGVFKESVEDSLDETDFATREDVHNYLDTKLGKADDRPDEDREPDVVARLEEAGLPDDLIDAVADALAEGEAGTGTPEPDVGDEQATGDMDDTIERATDRYLEEQAERLAKLHKEEQHQEEVEKLAASTLAGVEGSESEAVVDALFYEEDH